MSHAVVIGGSIAGLLSARVLLDHFDQVTLLERDQLPETPDRRPGVPQGHHVHALLLKGYQLLEELFPGITEDLTAQGAMIMDWASDWLFLTQWDWMPDQPADLKGLICSRLLLEWYLHRRLQTYPGFTLKQRCRVEAPLTEHQQVKGITYRDGDKTAQVLAADLVVDASGRNTQLPQWLSQRLQGYLDRVVQAANGNSAIQADFIRVAHLAEPPGILFKPSTAWKALTLKTRQDLPPARVG